MDPEPSLSHPDGDDKPVIEPDDRLSRSMSPADTEESDITPYLRYYARRQLNLARRALIPIVKERYRYDAFLSRLDHSSGELLQPQPNSAGREVFSHEKLQELRREAKARKATRDGRNPVVALRRNHAIAMWTEKRDSLRAEWDEAREGMERMNRVLGLTLIPPEHSPRTSGPDDDVREGVRLDERRRRHQQPSSTAAAAASASSSPSPCPGPNESPSGAWHENVQEPWIPGQPTPASFTGPPLAPPFPTTEETTALVPVAGISARHLMAHFSDRITDSRARNTEFFGVFCDTLAFDSVTRMFFRKDSPGAGPARTLVDIPTGRTRIHVRGLGRRAGGQKSVGLRQRPLRSFGRVDQILIRKG